MAGLPISRFTFDGDDPDELAARVRELTPAVEEVSAEVAEIVAAVRERGDRAVSEFTSRFDGIESPPADPRIPPALLLEALEGLDPEVRAAIEVAAAHIEAVATAEFPESRPAVDAGMGQRVRVERRPVKSAGIYAPGGRAPLLSSVLMCAVPARIAGVERIAVATPPGSDGLINAGVLAACAVAGVSEVYAVGGAQAIAALALGTDAIERVDVIAGPGNRYVTEAKRIVSGLVGIDGTAGPSELAIVADESVNPRWLALDLCAQAEHGAESLVILIASNPAVIDAVLTEVGELAGRRPSVTEAPLAIVQTGSLEQSLVVADALAAEHLQLAIENAEAHASGRVAGAVFCGPLGATAFGDYAAGSNHVLPTGGAARYGGPLGPLNFMRSTSVITFTTDSAAALAPHVAALAQAEGLPVHGESAIARAEDGSAAGEERIG